MKLFPFLKYFLIVLQILDGVFTYIAVDKYGVNVEANPLVKLLIVKYGHLWSLFVLKLLAIIIIIVLSKKADEYKFISNSLIFVAMFYFFFAIVPWVISYMFYI